MDTPFDLAGLRENIGDDAEVEKFLLSEFIDSATESLELLEKNMPEEQDEAYDQLWKSHMHQIKGAALNLGAKGLVDIAAQANCAYMVDSVMKRQILREVQKAFLLVKEYIVALYG